MNMPSELVDIVGTDSDDDNEDPLLNLVDIKKSKVLNFAIRANYTTWQPREAFRELLQNW